MVCGFQLKGDGVGGKNVLSLMVLGGRWSVIGFCSGKEGYQRLRER